MNNREIATVIWLGVVFLAVLVSDDTRAALREVVSAAAKLAIPLFAMTAYVGGLVYVCSAVGLWSAALITTVVAWFVGTGLGLFGKAFSVFGRGGSFKDLVVVSLGLTVYVEGFINLYVFPLAVELVFLPTLAFLAGLSVVAESQDRHSPAKRFEPGWV